MEEIGTKMQCLTVCTKLVFEESLGTLIGLDPAGLISRGGWSHSLQNLEYEFYNYNMRATEPMAS